MAELKGQCSYYRVMLWLGLFAMLMIHLGPLISATQELLLHEPASMQAGSAAVATDAQSEQYGIELKVMASVESEYAAQAMDHHALMGHHSVPAGAPQWLANLAMCGYCDLLTISPPLLLAVLLALAIVPLVHWLTVLPASPRLLRTANSSSRPRAPPVPLFV